MSSPWRSAHKSSPRTNRGLPYVNSSHVLSMEFYIILRQYMRDNERLSSSGKY